jgi:hypothetical protein
MGIEASRLLELPKIVDHRGNLTFIEGDRHVPFSVKRVYYLYDVPGGGARGGHAHRDLEQVIIAINGSFEVFLDDGRRKWSHRLWRGNEGLYLPTGIWRELGGFTSGSVCLVLASRPFDESDYIRDYDQFLEAVRRGEFPQ